MKYISILSSLLLSGLTLAQNQAQIFYSCAKPNTIALTIDDGPTEKNPELLDALDNIGIKATFYVNCNNLMKDVNGEPTALVAPYLKEIYERGHEIGSHTYNHACLTEQCILNNPLMKLMDTKETFTEQIVKNEDFIYNAIGVYPATYRAPFGDGQNPGNVNNTLLEWLYELGYPYAIHWDIETQDMENQNINDDYAFQQAQEHYNSEVGQKDKLITLQHAIPVTIEKIIPWIKDVWMPAHPNMKFVKVSECLGLTDADIYRTTKGPVKNPSSGNPSSDDSSNAKTIFTGLFGSVLLATISLLINYF
ncbi:glycoside hydrolase/deacetylase [Piromyces finnis]|uniref:Glycoside hydrolase/deacetylase n=1 Tax=Piromyces finnis TaxID=1754191 RepID=A0A1Y1VMI2_9FUNG|nr:glycoside hydrolase/deacetylase [Piromyces finnis]|eukprot:ORX60124.1 glycoside hydrolase/deacetylase [Piromyces finnis]